MIIENEKPYTQETIRLCVASVVPQDTLLGLGLVLIGAILGAGMFGATMFSAGWAASTVYRTVQSYIDARGTYAILWITIAVPIFLIWHTNKKGV